MQHAHAETLVGWYRDEVLGEALFLELAKVSADLPEQAAKWRTLANLEHCVQERIAVVLRERGVPIPQHDTDWQRGQAFAKPFLGADWGAVMRQLLPEGIKSLKTMQEAVGRMPPDLRAIARFVVAHEEALVEFITREIEGRGHDSLEGVVILLAEAEWKSSADRST